MVYVLLYLDLCVRVDHASSFFVCWIFKPTNQLTFLWIRCVAEGYFVLQYAFVVSCLVSPFPCHHCGRVCDDCCRCDITVVTVCCLWVFQVKVPRKVFNFKSKEVTGRCGKTVWSGLYYVYSSPCIINVIICGRIR
jgi:hypothetical protein